MKLHGLPGAHEITDRQHARFRVGARHSSHEKVALLKRLLVFIRRAAHMERRADEHPIVMAEIGVDLAEPFERRLAAEFDDHVGLGPRDHQRLADRPTALGDHRPDSHAPADHHAHGA